MARSPSYPDDAPVAGGTPAPDEAAPDDGGNRKKTLMKGAAIGIGSAALVAALLYANRSRKAERS